VPPPKVRQLPKTTKGSTTSLGKRKRDANEAMEEEQLARQLGVPIEEIPAMLKDDRVESTLSDETDGVDSAGTLYKMGTIDVYCAAIAELYETQRTNGTNPHPTFRGPAFKGLLESRRRAQDRNNRDDSVDRGRRAFMMVTA